MDARGAVPCHVGSALRRTKFGSATGAREFLRLTDAAKILTGMPVVEVGSNSLGKCKLLGNFKR